MTAKLIGALVWLVAGSLLPGARSGEWALAACGCLGMLLAVAVRYDDGKVTAYEETYEVCKSVQPW